jgi:hypothetical protein
MEMARDKHISSQVAEPLSLNSNTSNGYYNNWDQYRPGQDEYWGITSKSPSEFVKKDDTEETAKRTWEICNSVDAALEKDGKERKRRLVSLFEANEVARRVAGKKGERRGVVVNGGLVDGEIKKDLVSDWICKFLCFPRFYLMLHAKITKRTNTDLQNSHQLRFRVHQSLKTLSSTTLPDSVSIDPTKTEDIDPQNLPGRSKFSSEPLVLYHCMWDVCWCFGCINGSI